MEWMCRVADLAAYADEAVAVQAYAFGLADDEIAVRQRIMRRHATFEGVRSLGAFDADGRLVGFGYGYPNLTDQWWSLVIEPHLAREGHRGWLDESFVVGELHVLPRWQGHGIGRTLITMLCKGQDRDRILLSALDEQTPARKLYRALGFTDLARPVLFPGNNRPYTVMGATLPFD
ncbi:GNAT family N-acetyltransferase [Embleya sp. NBC_00896]|uniref:GNAT family N-acetyltransferase n=1 Tax=Embleya sp. NBC_00896 TaxID=2975961 RepID=UPI00386D972A|nr:GNAT family N-acetyltransferase [Embleya sp. NBC_00896]